MTQSVEYRHTGAPLRRYVNKVYSGENIDMMI